MADLSFYKLIYPVRIGSIPLSNIVANPSFDVCRSPDVSKEQYVNCRPDGEANVMTKDTAEGAFGFENMASSLDEYNAVEIFIFTEI